MKITRVETYIVGNPWKNWVFAKVHTDAGIYGIGERTVMYFAKTAEAAIHELTPFVIGMDPMQSRASPRSSLVTPTSIAVRFSRRSDRDRLLGHSRKSNQSARL